MKSGLSQCVVTDIIQDQRGFIWASTFDGLNRFDGTNIKVFRHDPQDKTSIISSKIFGLVADRNDHLYLNTNDGFCIFDCKTERVLKPDLIKQFEIHRVANRDKYHVWCYGEENGILLVDTRDFSYELMPNSVIAGNSGPVLPLKIYESGNMIYMVLENGDMFTYDIQTRKRLVYPNTLQKGGTFTCTDKDKYGRIYIASNDEDLQFFDIRSKAFYKTDFYAKSQKLIAVNNIKYDAVNNVLLLSSYGQGIFIYEYETGNVKQFKKNDELLPISSNYVLSLCANNFGIIFIGYDGMGIDVVDPFIKKFTPVTHEAAEDENSLKYVRKIIEDDNGDLLIGTSESGLIKYNRGNGDLKFYNYKSSITENRAFIIEMIRTGNEVWLGYNGSGVGIIDINTLKLRKNILPGTLPDQLSDGTIWSFVKDSANNMWIGTRQNGLNKVDLRTNLITQYNKDRYPDFAENGVRCIYNFKAGELILGTEKGLFLFDIKNEKLQKIFPLNENEGSFKSIKSIYTDYKHRYWIATDGGGIVILDNHFKVLRNFNTNNGLNNNVVYGILPQNDSSLWISTNAGICNIIWNEKNIYNNVGLKSHCYDELNGLQSNEFNTGAYTLLKDNSMVFGGLNGINVFKPENIKNSPMKPEVYINELKVFDNAFASEIDISYLDHIDLKPFENSISITFSTLGFSLPEKTTYMYRLIGYDKDWVVTKNRNYISYTNLPSGEYEFQVKATNYDGIWNENATRMHITIATPFYNTWWFYTLIAAALGSVIFAFYRYRTKQIKEKEKIKLQFTKELAEVEMKALRAQINPHFLFNSLNSINNYILKNDTKLASKYLVKFSQLVRNILNNSSSPYITLQEELRTIELYMLIEGMRFSNQFSYHIEVAETLNTGVIYIPSLLLQPYVENAIWHGLLHKEGEKHIIISVKKIDSGSISITIEDNGVGRKAAEEIEQRPKHRKSFGMQLGESRIRLLNQGNSQTAKVDVIDLYNEQKNPSGTKIDIIIPAKINVIDSSNLN